MAELSSEENSNEIIKKCTKLGILRNSSWKATSLSIITQVIIEILALSLSENAVIFCYNHLRRAQFFNMAASRLRFVYVSEKEINFMKENAIPRNTKHATKLGMTLFKDKMWTLR